MISSDLEENNPPAVRKIVVTNQLFKTMENFLLDPDLEHSPTDFEKGRDFTIEVTPQGEWKNYSTSSFSMKERALTKAEKAAVDGRKALRDYLPAKPSEDDLEALVANAMAGEPFQKSGSPFYYNESTFAQKDAQTLFDHANGLKEAA